MPSPRIDIPPDDVFKNDRLGLEPAIVARSEALLSRSPQAIAIDGHWGTGKSTFLALWAAHLRLGGVKVIEFNAWKSFGSDPFDALTREILRQVNVPTSEQKPPHRRLIEFLNRYAPLVAQGTKLASSLQTELEGVASAIELGLIPALKAASSEPDDASVRRIDSPDRFASVLSSAASSWSDEPIVIMIDELDRCSPDYAVEMLQLLEHVFYTDNLVFVVSVNRSELIHSIRAFYGQGFNAEGYLERFFDDMLPLPTSSRSSYIESSLKPMRDQTVLTFLEASDLSLREIDKAVHLLKTIGESWPNRSRSLFDLWICRTLAPVEYRQFLSGEMSDKELAEAIFSRGSCASLRADRQGGRNECAQQVELTLIAGSCTLPRGSPPTYYESAATKSQLYLWHQSNAEDEQVESDISESYSRGVMGYASSLAQRFPRQGDIYDIRLAARLLDRESPNQ